MKKLPLFIIPLVLVTVLATPAFAQMPASEKPGRSGTMMKDKNPMQFKEKKEGSIAAEQKELRQEARMEKKVGTLQERADREITRRINSLETLIDRINALTRLEESQKEALVTQVQTEIDSLTTLQAKIKANTNPETLKTDVQSIVTSYRIYALFMPKITILAMAERLGATADQLSMLATKLQTRIDMAKAEGKEIGAMQSSLLAMQKKIADAKTQEQNAIDAVLSLTPEGYPGNKKTLQEARGMLQKGHQQLVEARKDSKQILSELRK